MLERFRIYNIDSGSAILHALLQCLQSAALQGGAVSPSVSPSVTGMIKAFNMDGN